MPRGSPNWSLTSPATSRLEVRTTNQLRAVAFRAGMNGLLRSAHPRKLLALCLRLKLPSGSLRANDVPGWRYSLDARLDTENPPCTELKYLSCSSVMRERQENKNLKKEV